MIETRNSVIRIGWTECERGFGQRFDCYSYHASMEEAQNYLLEYYAGLPPAAPGIYYAAGVPVEICVEAVFCFLVQGKRIIWDSANYDLLNDD